ncbi:two-component system sporulation sensor kinase B [Paenibacillus harenae]|uniref:histidine kinase n=2 Tax=Paenibacillus harenae TaxID=306543 RepID=A0ABT9U557_PAEHA|nr:two-component system sporulation sensor kinase B [Paenibacillus harenae]
MIAYYKDFMLNIFLIFSPLVFYPYIFRVKGRLVLYRFLLYIVFAIALITTMSFPIHINGLTYDFRSIPLAIGSLYGGMPVALLLYATLLIYRYLLGSPNELLYICALLPSLIVVYGVNKRYHTLKLPRKIIVAVLLCTSIKLIAFSIYFALIGKLELFYGKPLATLQTYLVQGVIVGIGIYLIEKLVKYFYMQEEVIRSEKMKIVGDMAASVAHEIRNPLTTVRGFIELLGTANLSQQKKDFYKQISLEELDRAQLIITDYLALAKPDPETVENIDLNEEVRYLSNVLLTYANYNNIQIKENVAAEQPLLVAGDRYKFRQAMINIGKNAIEAMPGGGVLEIRSDKTHDELLIRISDNGCGMTQEQIRRLGTPYYSTKEKGTGLGTMVSFGIIKKMNGKIDIQSKVGAGTTFQFSFAKDAKGMEAVSRRVGMIREKSQ